MPFPPGIPTVRVTYTAAAPAGGTPAQGTVEFVPVAPAISLPEYGIVYSGRGLYTLDEHGRLVDTDGTAGVPLLACDIPGANPAEWIWQVTVSLDNAGPLRRYLSLSITQDEVDLGTITQVDPSRAHYVAVPGPRGEPGPPGPQGPPGPPPADAETPAGALEKIASHVAATDPHGDRAWAGDQFYPLADGNSLSSHVSDLLQRVVALEAALAPPSQQATADDATWGEAAGATHPE
ncbi:hypothetical protein [Streptomyces gardneri]|uniref:hypothetical protein n=1 Tax=Streptomyces gardneri TaxID=66892 RepID=UPI0035DEA2D8